jgi:hypothetical protein
MPEGGVFPKEKSEAHEHGKSFIVEFSRCTAGQERKH